jgi:hypothetical protein
MANATSDRATRGSRETAERADMDQIDPPPDVPSRLSLIAKMAIVATLVVVAGIGFLWHSSRSARSEAPRGTTVPIKWSTSNSFPQTAEPSSTLAVEQDERTAVQDDMAAAQTTRKAARNR